MITSSVLDKVRSPGICAVSCPDGNHQFQIDANGGYSPDSDLARQTVLDLAPPLYQPGSKTKAYDRSRYGNHGTFTDITYKQNNKGLWVMEFNGSSSYISLGDSLSLSALGPLAFWAWTKAIDNTHYHGIICKDFTAAPQREWEFRIEITTGTLTMLLISADAANSLQAKGTNNICDNIWHKTTGIWDGVNDTGHITLCLDSVSEVLTNNIKGATGFVPHDGTDPVHIGVFGALVGSRYLNGLMSNHTILSLALPAAVEKYLYDIKAHLFAS